MPGVLAGTLLTFIPAAGDYVNAELLGSDNTKMVGNVIESQFFRVPGGFPTAAALSFTLMALILAMVFVYVRRFGTEELVTQTRGQRIRWIGNRFAMIVASSCCSTSSCPSPTRSPSRSTTTRSPTSRGTPRAARP
jgi:ABC-type Fe3+ transport system permease subunit